MRKITSGIIILTIAMMFISVAALWAGDWSSVASSASSSVPVYVAPVQNNNQGSGGANYNYYNNYSNSTTASNYKNAGSAFPIPGSFNYNSPQSATSINTSFSANYIPVTPGAVVQETRNLPVSTQKWQQEKVDFNISQEKVKIEKVK